MFANKPQIFLGCFLLGMAAIVLVTGIIVGCDYEKVARRHEAEICHDAIAAGEPLLCAKAVGE